MQDEWGPWEDVTIDHLDETSNTLKQLETCPLLAFKGEALYCWWRGDDARLPGCGEVPRGGGLAAC
eukprot:3809411-Pleurochrysis_carterae.AAC.1